MPDKTVGHPYDQITTKLTNAIMMAIKRSPTSDKPFNSVPISDDEQLTEYEAMSKDVNKWYNVLKKQGLNGMMRYNAAMVKLRQKKQGGQNAPTMVEGNEQNLMEPQGGYEPSSLSE